MPRGQYVRQARPTARPEPRAAAPRDPAAAARAKQRASALLESVDLDSTGADEFYIDPGVIPDGWCYEWKRHTVLNAPDPAYQVQVARMGWESVPADRHPEMMPLGYEGKVIERKGMILMERPQEITDMIRERDDREARSRVQGVSDNLRGAPQGQFGRDNDGESMARVSRTIEPMAIPD